MAVICRFCGARYEARLFRLGRAILCECGTPVGRDLQPASHREGRRKMELLRRSADRVCSLILIHDYPAVDIEIEMNKVRRLAMEMFPGREDLYEMIYESRFRRLWEQFRSAG